MRVGLILSEVFTGLRRNISMVISVILVTFVSLTFVGAAILMQSQVGLMRSYWANQAQVAVYMCSTISDSSTCTDGAATDEQLDAVREQLESESIADLIREVRFVTKEEAYEDAVAQLDDGPASLLTPEAMGEEFRINMKDPATTDVIVEAFADTNGVEEVLDQRRYVQPLYQALTVATYGAVAIAGLMLIAAVLLISTTIRLSAYARRKEIGIMRLVGASNRFIQTPFVLEGVIAALIGSVLASVAVVAGVHFGVTGYLRYEISSRVWIDVTDTVWVVPVLIAIGVVLSALAAGFAIRRWLRA